MPFNFSDYALCRKEDKFYKASTRIIIGVDSKSCPSSEYVPGVRMLFVLTLRVHCASLFVFVFVCCAVCAADRLLPVRSVPAQSNWTEKKWNYQHKDKHSRQFKFVFVRFNLNCVLKTQLTERALHNKPRQTNCADWHQYRRHIMQYCTVRAVTQTVQQHHKVYVWYNIINLKHNATWLGQDYSITSITQWLTPQQSLQ
jgi:hypothetical protein